MHYWRYIKSIYLHENKTYAVSRLI